MSDTIYKCAEHQLLLCPDAVLPDHCWMHHQESTKQPCRMVERRLVSPTAIVIPRDEDGNWPLFLLSALEDHYGEPWTVQAIVEQALASSQGVEP